MRPVPQCGTAGGYRRHLRLGEQSCRPCRDAEAERGAERRREERHQAEAATAATVWQEPEPYQPPPRIAPGGGVAWYLSTQLDRLPDHDGTILFAARVLAPCVGQIPPQTLNPSTSDDAIAKRTQRARERADGR